MVNGEKNKRSKFISVRDASLFTGLSMQTIRKMVDKSQINGYKTPTGHRKIDRAGIQEMCYNDIPDEENFVGKKQNILYARVSTRKQVDDLSRQIEYLRRPEYSEYTLIQDIGSGINFKRKGLSTILDSCIQRTIGEVVVAHRDRLCRFAFELIESLIKKAGGKLTVLNDSGNKSSENELAEDLLSIIHIFNCRQMGRRSYKSRKGKESESDKDTDLSNSSPETETSWNNRCA